MPLPTFCACISHSCSTRHFGWHHQWYAFQSQSMCYKQCKPSLRSCRSSLIHFSLAEVGSRVRHLFRTTDLLRRKCRSILDLVLDWRECRVGLSRTCRSRVTVGGHVRQGYSSFRCSSWPSRLLP